MSTLKYPLITSISTASTRSKDWDDVLTAHTQDNVARTWRVQDKRVGAWKLEMQGTVQVSALVILVLS